jgi:hypothetical protein
MLSCTAFEGSRRIAAGEVAQVALKVKKVVDRGARGPVLVFDDATSEQIELDLRGTAEEVTRRVAAAQPPAPAPDEPRGPGRPKLGVIAREVTLLPGHWEWLGRQPGGASVTLRKLVEEARKANAGKERVRQAQEAAYRFMSAMAGNRPGFEEATRALFAGKQRPFDELVEAWPADIRDHARKLAQPALGSGA